MNNNSYLHMALKKSKSVDPDKPTATAGGSGSGSCRIPTTPPAPAHKSQNQKLDALLDELENEYGFFPKSERTDKGKNELDDVSDLEDFKLWNTAKDIRNHNVSYRTTTAILRKMQQEQRDLADKLSKGLHVAGTTISTTSVSSLESGDSCQQIYNQVQELSNKTEYPDQKSLLCVPTSSKSHKHVTFKEEPLRIPPSARSLRQTSIPKVDKAPLKIPCKPAKIATPTMASTAKITPKSKSKLPMSNPIKNSPRSSRALTPIPTPPRNEHVNRDTTSSVSTIVNNNENLNQDHNSIASTSLQNNNQQVLPGPVAGPSRIPTSLTRIKASLNFSNPASASVSNKSVTEPPPPAAIVHEKVDETPHVPEPIRKISSVQMKPEHQNRPSSSTSSMGPIGLDTKNSTLLDQKNPNQTDPFKGIDARRIVQNLLDHAKTASTKLFDIGEGDAKFNDPRSDAESPLIIRGLLEHSKSAAMALFDLTEEDFNGNVMDDSMALCPIPDATYTLDKNDIDEDEEKARQHFINEAPKMQMVFGFPYIPGASKMPRTANF